MEIVSEKLLFRLKILGGLGFPRINPTIYHFFINIIIHQPQQWIHANSCILIQLGERERSVKFCSRDTLHRKSSFIKDL